MRTIFLLLLLPTLPAVAQSGNGARGLQDRLHAARDRVFPALVHIMNVEEFFSAGKKRKSVSSGSGCFIDQLGHIVTNDHVAGKASQLIVTLANRTKVPAVLVASDPYTDLAVIKVDPKKAFPGGQVPTATFADSDKVREGDFVMAMGSPLSLSRSISFGIVSSRSRLLNTMRIRGHETGKYNTWLQTDAAINPGNSGGPLVNLAGQVVGVNTRANLGANNIGFAIPSNIVREVAADLLKLGAVRRAYLGLTVQPLDSFGDDAGVTRGALVAAVAPGSPASRVGIRPGDFITKLDGKPFGARFAEQLPGLYRRISKLTPGKGAKLTVSRTEKGSPREFDREVVPVVLGADLDVETQLESWGITVRGLTTRYAQSLGLKSTEGVVVTGLRPGGPASGLLEAGVVVLRVNGQRIKDRAAFERIYGELEQQKATEIRIVKRSGAILDVAVLQPTYGDKKEDR